MPFEVQKLSVSQLPLSDLLEFNRNAHSPFKALTQTGPVLNTTIIEQFYEAIQKLFAYTSEKGWEIAKDINQATINSQSQNLMEVLRSLHDKVYYKNI